jgi:Immunoglobulin I-set domain
MKAKFTACATGTPVPTVEWFKNGKKLIPSDRLITEEDPNGLLRLIIEGVHQDDVGKYTCKITNPHGEDTCHADLYYESESQSCCLPRGHYCYAFSSRSRS